MGIRKTVRVVGTGMTRLGRHNKPASHLMKSALHLALDDAGIQLSQVDGLIAVPSLANPRFMEAHYLATRVGILPGRDKVVRTLDTGGAGPITGLLEAADMIQHDDCQVVAVVAGDSVSSLSTKEFLSRADRGCRPPSSDEDDIASGVDSGDGAAAALSAGSPVIPLGYDRIAQWQMERYCVSREQLAMVSVIMSHQASRHPYALTRTPHTLESVLSAPDVGAVTSRLECARRADGGAAIVLASSKFLERQGRDMTDQRNTIVFLGGGEAAGPLYVPREITEEMFSCERACAAAYDEAGCGPRDIDFFGLYDCFPICFVRAVEAAGLAEKGQGGRWVEDTYMRLMDWSARGGPRPSLPVNTHGGLLAFGAPWETPAMYNTIEAVAQLRKQAGDRQVEHCRRALVYGNGGVFSHSAVAIMSDGQY